MLELDITVRLVSETTEFHTLRDRWNELADDSVYPNIFTTWEWCSLWWKWFGKEELQGELFILVFESGNQIVGLFPLYRTPRGKNLRFLGYGAHPTGEYFGPIIRLGWMEPVCEAAMAFFLDNKKEWNSLFFESYALDDPGTSLFANKMKEGFPSYFQEDQERLYVRFTGTYDDYLKSLSTNNRHYKLKRMRQAFNKFGATLHLLQVGEQETWFPVFVELMEDSRKRRKEISPYQKRLYREFHKELQKTLLEQNKAVVYLLKYGEIPAAVLYSFWFHGKCSTYQIGISSSLKGSPGDVIYQSMMKKTIEDGGNELDFLRGIEPYKLQYTDTSRKTEMLALFSGKNLCYYTSLFIYCAYRPFRRMVKRFLFGLLGKGKSKEKTEPENKPNDTKEG